MPEIISPTGLSANTGLGAGLLRCGSINEFRAAAALPLHSQELIDRTVLSVGLERLAVVKTLLAKGLIYPLPNFLSVLELVWEKISKAGNARQVINPSARGERAMPDRQVQRMPIPLQMVDFSFGIRAMLEAERAGAPLDVTMVAESARRINELIEELAINGWGVTANGNGIPGLLNAPSHATQLFQGSLAWDNASKTGAGIVTDILAMIAQLQANFRYGPYALFISTNYGNALNADFKANGSDTILDRVNRIPEIETVVVADRLPSNTAVLIELTTGVVDVVYGQPPTHVAWTDGPGWEFNNAVMSCILVRFKDDYDGHSGVCVGTPT